VDELDEDSVEKAGMIRKDASGREEREESLKERQGLPGKKFLTLLTPLNGSRLEFTTNIRGNKAK